MRVTLLLWSNEPALQATFMQRAINRKERNKMEYSEFLLAAIISKAKHKFCRNVIHNPKVGGSILPPATNSPIPNGKPQFH
jgi:hypothetical protein